MMRLVLFALLVGGFLCSNCWKKDNLSFHDVLPLIRRGRSREEASDTSWQEVQTPDVDMESVGDSVYTALSVDVEEQMVEKLRILEEVCNVNGQLLRLYSSDSVDHAY